MLWWTLRKLRSGDEDARSAAAMDLGISHAQDPDVVEPLLAALGDPSPFVRRSVVDALGRTGSSRAIRPLIKIVEAATPPDARMAASAIESAKSQANVVERAVEALGRIGDAKAVEPLLGALARIHAGTRAFDGQGYSRTVGVLAIARSLADLGVKGDKRAIDPVAGVIRELEERREREPGSWCNADSGILKSLQECLQRMDPAQAPPPRPDTSPAAFANRYKTEMLKMREVDRNTFELLHQPVYDCGSDDCYLPCAHPTFDSGAFDGSIGWLASEVAAADWADAHAHRTSGATALIIGEDHLTFLFTERPAEPGAYVERVARTGPAEWFVYRWTSGFRGSATDLDPPFALARLQPAQWHAREREAAHLGRGNEHWLAAQSKCAHRSRP